MSGNNTVHRFLTIIEQLGLLIILIATIIAIGQEIMIMVEKLRVDLIDLF